MMRKLNLSQVSQYLDKEVELFGWIDVRRDHGKLIFLDLRDRSGKVQLVVAPSDKETHAIASGLRPEWVIKITGIVASRPEGMVNLKEGMSGKIEVKVSKIEVLSEAKTPPFALDSDGREIDEEIRLKYRYLDLRRARLQKNLILRSEFLKHIRDFLYNKDFLEIETPMLTKSTPEGSRDFVVPSRLHSGKFYALPQSPQQYKQLLMVAGFERYFQIARAMRDEDTRADRGLEHTQIDLEMSFVEQKDVMSLVEEMVIFASEKIGQKIMQKPFPIFTYDEAMEKFKADKFDLRADKDSKELAFAWVVDFPVFSAEGGSASGGEKALTYSHNPFTAPKADHVENLLLGKNLELLTSLQYDLVCNGHEVGGGGIRINKPEVLEKVFEILGHSKEEIREKFGHMLDAFEYGAPPHGGIALGLDRLIMMFQGEEALREVVAFPLTGDGRDPMMDSPSTLTKKQLEELHIKVEEK
ncbi:MAG: aspartate--tRNA ligase [bacterium]|nr:aspartate--tRNA ligase [bacterium]